MVDQELFDEIRGQRMLLTTWIRNDNTTEDPAEEASSARTLAGVPWAHSIGAHCRGAHSTRAHSVGVDPMEMSPAHIAQGRELPHQAMEMFELAVHKRQAGRMALTKG